MSFKKTYNLPYLSLMFITVNHELGYKFITSSIATCASFYASPLFFCLSLLSQLYEDYFSRHLFKLSSDSSIYQALGGLFENNCTWLTPTISYPCNFNS